jgi:hypothetical protein
MKRLDTISLSSLLDSAGIAVVFFSGGDEKATMTQAEQFALLWADTVSSNSPGIRFGYADESVDWLSQRSCDAPLCWPASACKNRKGAEVAPFEARNFAATHLAGVVAVADCRKQRTRRGQRG